MSAWEEERRRTRGAVREGGDVHDVHHFALHAPVARRRGRTHQLRVVRLLVAPPVTSENATCETTSTATLPCRPGEGGLSIRPLPRLLRSSIPNSRRCSRCCKTRTLQTGVYKSQIECAPTSSNTSYRVPSPASSAGRSLGLEGHTHERQDHCDAAVRPIRCSNRLCSTGKSR